MQKLVLVNQFGEESINYVEGFYIPLPGAGNIIIMNGATAPINGTTGDNIAGKGSLYIAQDTGALYLQTSAITTPVWSIVEAGNASVIGSVLTGFSASAGTVGATDSILVGFNKLAGNTQNKTVLANLLTAFSAGAGTVTSADTVLEGLQKITGNIQNKTVLANVLTGFVAGGGTVTSSDTVLQGVQKLAGNVAAFQTNSVAADVAALVVDFNALLAKLIAAKLMAAS